MLPWIGLPIGMLLIFVAVRDILLTLMTATGRGAISRWFMAAAWHLMRPIAGHWPSFREIAGPLTFIAVIGLWTTMIATGWALIYWPFLPSEFLVDFGLDLERGSSDNFLAALYFSLVTLTTMGFGDIVPTGAWLRLLTPLEGLLGFGLITAGISWFLSNFPALSRRRNLAHQIRLVREAEEETADSWQPETMTFLMDSFSTQLIDVRSDQIQFPVIYYFRDVASDVELVENLRYLLETASTAEEEYGEPGSRMYLHEHMLRRAVDDYLQTLGSQFLGIDSNDTEKLLAALEGKGLSNA